MVIKGVASSPVEVTLGVPQGSILCPLMFLLFINDIDQHLSPGSRVSLYADALYLYRKIVNIGDTVILQRDLDQLASWSQKWRLCLNTQKCKVMSITKKTGVDYDYKINKHQLEKVS